MEFQNLIVEFQYNVSLIYFCKEEYIFNYNIYKNIYLIIIYLIIIYNNNYNIIIIIYNKNIYIIIIFIHKYDINTSDTSL